MAKKTAPKERVIEMLTRLMTFCQEQITELQISNHDDTLEKRKVDSLVRQLVRIMYSS
jgi:hypothetical protein